MAATREIFGVKIRTGVNTHPGSGAAECHHEEHEIFQRALSLLGNKENPVMIEVGSFWALWSLCFRRKFPDGQNILIELGKRQLKVGVDNFKLNQFSQTHHWGGFFLERSGTFKNRKNDLEYEKAEGEYFDDSISVEVVGPELEFVDIWNKERLTTVDLLHMDIQGSELPLIRQLEEACVLNHIHTLIIATHSPSIHEEILSILKLNKYHLTFVQDSISLYNNDTFEDGHIVATR